MLDFHVKTNMATHTHTDRVMQVSWVKQALSEASQPVHISVYFSGLGHNRNIIGKRVTLKK